MKNILALAGAMCLVAPPVRAQSTYGTLLGLVEDQAGAAVPNATVTVTEVNTHISKSINTSGLGSFEIPNRSLTIWPGFAASTL